ncbi:MAG: single-stranded DNA-binding protein [Christensenellales bacterium]|jgi:single-stranded DNA-binding protein
MNYEQMNNNKVYLTGTIISEPEFSHEVFGEGFYEMKITVPRLSEQYDILPITISERLIEDNLIKVNKQISIAGQFRSYNKIEGAKSRLMLTVFVREINTEESPAVNLIELNGYICKPPIYRTTPFKREICDILIAVNRAYNKSDYIPCIAWGRNARFIKNAEVGEKVKLSGRIQSRDYQKQMPDGKIETKTAYEVSISKIVSEKSVDYEVESE